MPFRLGVSSLGAPGSRRWWMELLRQSLPGLRFFSDFDVKVHIDGAIFGLAPVWMLHGTAFGDPVRGRFLFFFSCL